MPTPKLMQAVNQFYSSLVELLRGNPEPMFKVWSHAEDVTYMGPVGGLLVGWENIKASWISQSKTIHEGHVQPQDLHFYEKGDLAVVVGHEDSAIQMDGKLVKIKLIATSAFRLENGEFKMIAHHTDLF